MARRSILVAVLLCLACGGTGRQAVDGVGDLAGGTEGQDGNVPDDVGEGAAGLPDGAVDLHVDVVPEELPQTDDQIEEFPLPDVPVEVAADVKQPCGDLAVAENYSKCNLADDEESCEAAGGTWTIVGLAPEPECLCPTGQGGCPCKSPADCLSSCVADFVGGQMFDCEGVTAGHCSPVSITVGCWCYFMQDGSVMGLCAD